VSSSTFSASGQRRLHRAQSLLSEVVSARASLGQLPHETAELPLTGLMGSEHAPPRSEISDNIDDVLLEFAPVTLSPLSAPSIEGEAGHFEVDDELKDALLEASAAHTGQTDELTLSPSSDLEEALHEALEGVSGAEDVKEPEALMVSQPTPVAYHPNQPAPMRALWGRRGFTPTPEVKPQAELQSTAPRLAFEDSQELLELVEGSGDDEGISLDGPEVPNASVEAEPSEEAPLFTAAYAPLESEVELKELATLEVTLTQDETSSSTSLEEVVAHDEPEAMQEGFGGVSSSPDEPKPEVLERAWTEVASPQERRSRSGSLKLLLALILLALGLAGVYYYDRFML